jgi:dimethylargininase
MNVSRAQYAIVRGVPHSYERCIRRPGSFEPIDVELAREQHGRYCDALESLGLIVTRVEPDDRYPDCCFVEDPAVVVGDQAVLLNVGAPSRIGETEGLRDPLRIHRQILEMAPPATLDGGDVLFTGDTFFVGISERSNRAGFEMFERVANENGYDAVPVPLRNALHLKSACTYIGDGHIVVVPGCFDEAIFHNFRRIHVSNEDEYSANCLGVNGRVLVSEGYPKTKSAIEAEGFKTIGMQMSEFYKGGGSLTCLSIIF